MKDIDRKQFEFVNIIKCLAVMLVLNSHYDSLYPIKALATGGALGNSLFFAITGYLTVNVTLPFRDWIVKKYSRIYIPTIICTLLIFLSYGEIDFSILSVFKNLIWPTKFWFIGALVIFYPLFYLVITLDLIKYFRNITIGMLVFYALYYIFLLDTSYWVIEAVGLTSIEGLFKLIFYFYIMLVGAVFRLGRDNFPNFRAKKSFLIAFVSVLLMYAHKAAMTKSIIFMHLQFLNHLCILTFVICLFLACVNIESFFKRIANFKLYWIVRYISSHTLEIYLVQFWVIGKMKLIIFPINIIATTIIVLILAGLLHYILTLFEKN